MDKKDISRLLISFLYGIDPSIVTSYKPNDFHVVIFRNKNGDLIDSKVRFTDDGLEWGNLNGRWRNDKKDAKITYKVYGNKVKFTETYATGGKLVREVAL